MDMGYDVDKPHGFVRIGNNSRKILDAQLETIQLEKNP